MDGGIDTTLLTVLTRRDTLLERLSAAPAPKRELARDLDISRSTVDRGISSLERLNLVVRDGRSYRTTLAGELALEEYDRSADRVAGAVDAGDVLTSLPSDARIDPAFLGGAVVDSTRPPPSRRAVRPLEDLIETADRYRAYVPTALSRLVPACCDAVLEGLAAEVALTSEALDELIARHREPIAAALDTGRLDVFEVPAALSYGLVVADRDDRRAAVILVYADDVLEGSIYNDGVAAVEWAESTLDDVWERTSPLTFPGE